MDKSKKDHPDHLLVALSSWCSSCKSSLQHVKAKPQESYVLVVFDEPEDVAKVLVKFGVEAPCFYVPEVERVLKIDELPWRKKFRDVAW